MRLPASRRRQMTLGQELEVITVQVPHLNVLLQVIPGTALDSTPKSDMSPEEAIKNDAGVRSIFAWTSSSFKSAKDREPLGPDVPDEINEMRGPEIDLSIEMFVRLNKLSPELRAAILTELKVADSKGA